jgi:hypothetical protein
MHYYLRPGPVLASFLKERFDMKFETATCDFHVRDAGELSNTIGFWTLGWIEA